MIRRHVGASALALVVITAFTACANTIAGTATWPGAKLEEVVLTAAGLPAGRAVRPPHREARPTRRRRRPARDAVEARRLLRRADEGDRRIGRAGRGQRGEVQRRLRRRAHRDDRADVEPGSGQARGHRRTVCAVSDVLRPVVGGHSDDHHQIADAAPRRAGVRADHGPQRSEEQCVLLVRKRPRDGGVRNRFSHTRIRRSRSKPRCRRRFWTITGKQAERLQAG